MTVAGPAVENAAAASVGGSAGHPNPTPSPLFYLGPNGGGGGYSRGISVERVEWAQLAGQAVIATERRFWLQPLPQPAPWVPFCCPMTGDGSVASTANLLDGAIAAAGRASPKGPPSPALTILRWAWRLIASYQTTSATPPLMREAAERLATEGRPALAAHCAQVADEEEGHDGLALRDLTALGYEADALVAAISHPTSSALVECFRSTVRGPHPVRCLGYAYALERLASLVPRAYVESVERMLPPGVRATRCLRVHSSLGSDTRHVRASVDVIARLPAADRTLVAAACHDTARVISRAATPRICLRNAARCLAVTVPNKERKQPWPNPG